MKANYTKNTNHNANFSKDITRRSRLGEIDRLALEFDALTRKRLRDGVLVGILHGREAEIRQEAIMILLRWHFQQSRKSESNTAKGPHMINGSSNILQSVARALGIAKKRLIFELSKENKGRELINETNGGICQHEMNLPSWSWPEPVRRAMALCGIRRATDCGLISVRNATVARLVLEDGLPVEQVAAQFGVTWGAIYQQLRRVGAFVPAVMDEIEVPNFDIV
ncbi:MAG: hypothetical protein WCP35_15485 [Verrucomicrobiota bacterium]